MYVLFIGKFEQILRDHLRSQFGCSECSYVERTKLKVKPLDEFIRKSVEIHGDKFDYSEFVYVNNKTSGKLKCNSCQNSFTMRPDMHLSQKQGCPSCKKSAIYSKEYYISKGLENHPCKLYIVEFESDCEKFIKVGLTKHDKVMYRFRGYSDYNITVLHEWNLDFFSAYDIEQDVLKKFKKDCYKPIHKFKGHTEVLNYSVLNNVLSTIVEIL